MSQKWQASLKPKIITSLTLLLGSSRYWHVDLDSFGFISRDLGVLLRAFSIFKDSALHPVSCFPRFVELMRSRIAGRRLGVQKR